MKFSQMTQRVGNRFKQRVGAVLNNLTNIFNTQQAFSIAGVNGTVNILNSTDVVFTVSSENSNTRVMYLIPKKKFIENKSYVLSFNTNYEVSDLTVGDATNGNDTSSYTKYLNYKEPPIPNTHIFTIDTIDKDNVCIYFYFRYAPVGKTITIKNLTIK